MERESHAAAFEALFEWRLTRYALDVPQLPEVAVRVVRSSAHDAGSAQQLSDIIDTDPALTQVILRIAASAAKRPALPVTSLQHAVAWLGFNEVANIAFTLALQAKMLDVPGQQLKARRLWRHALASALWARQLAQRLHEETGVSYLCGLVHAIGKVVTLRAVHELARESARVLCSDEYDRLIALYYREVGSWVVTTWQLPPPVLAVTLHWEEYASAGTARLQSNIVNVAHQLADYTLFSPTAHARDTLVTAAAYRHLGLGAGASVPLFDSAGAIEAELDLYLAP